MRGPPRPCGSKRWNGPVIGYETRTSGVPVLPPNSAITVSPATAVWPTATRGVASSGRKHIDARSEADQAEALANADIAALLGPADDSPCHEPGDLHGSNSAVRTVDDDAVALVLMARLVEFGIQKFTRPMLDLGDPAAHRGAVHVAGKDIHEHGDARHLGIAEAEFARRHRWTDRRNHTIGRAYHQPVVGGRHALWVAEEVGAPARDDQTDPEQIGREQAKDQR